MYTIIKQLKFILVLGLLLLPQISGAESLNSVDFFYATGCPHCTVVRPLVNQLQDKYPTLKFNSYDIYQGESSTRLYELYDKYDIGQADRGGVPVVFVGDKYLLGDVAIKEKLESYIIEYLNNKTLQTETDKVLKAKQTYSWWAITGAAVVDSINPCAIAVLLILLTALMVGANDKKKSLLGGLLFTLSVYITYLLFGLGLIKIISLAGWADFIGKIVGVLAIIIGLANLKDFFYYGGGGFVMEIPRSWRPTLKKLLSSVTSPLGAFLIGFVVTMFELPCTGGPYFFVLGLLAESYNWHQILPLLMYYNLVFVAPLLVIVLAVYFGISSIKKAEEWKDKNIKVLHLIGGIIMLLLGIWVFIV